MFPNYLEDTLIENSFEDVVSKREVAIPQLTCMGKVSFAEDCFHTTGYVCSREFDSVLNNRDPSHSLHVQETAVLFNMSFIFEEAFWNDDELLFMLAKTAFERIELAAKGNQVHSVNTSSLELRQNIISFMSYLRIYTHRFLADFGKEEELGVLYEKLTQVIKHVSSWLGCVSDMPSVIFSNGSLMNNNSATAILFHTYFDVKWSLLEIAYMAANLRKYNESSRKSRESFVEILLQLEESLCGDLLYMAIRRFQEVSPGDWSGSTPFTCTCIRELWFMLLVFLKTENSVFGFVLKQFTSLLETKPLGCLSYYSDTKRLQMPAKDPLALVWLFAHLSRLSGFSQTGMWDRNFSRMESNYDVVNKLVQLYFSGTDAVVTEDRTRGLMGCLYSLSHVWGSNLNLCIILWEYFHKKIDENFSQTSAFEAAPYSSSLTWYEILTANVEPWKTLTARHSSYFIFLRLLGHHMELMNIKGQASLKARLYVKLQGKKIQELSLIGLYHMISACLTIVLTSESSDDMCAKILEMSANHKQKSIFFVAEMVMLLICVSRGRDCQEVATSLSSHLEKISRGLKDGEPKVREEQRKCGTMFVENFQEVIFQSKNFSHGQIHLIGKPLRSYLKNCGSCDRSAILDGLVNMMRKLRGSPTGCEEMFAAVMAHVYPLMKEKFASVEHVSFFVELTSISLETSRPEFQSIFTFLCLDEKVSPRLSLKYLSHLFETRQVLVNLSLSLDNYQAILIQSWFRISFLLPATGDLTDDFDRLNSIVKRLPRMAELSVQSKIESNSNDMIIDFLLMISANHQNVQSFSERATVRDTYLQYIGPLDKYLSCGFASGVWEDSDQLSHALRLGGQLYFHCGNIIYTKGKIDCLLAQLNNLLLIPIHFSDVNKELPTSAISPLQQYLPTFIFGLFRLNPSRDPYIMRCLSSIFQTYMTRFPPNHSHPFTRCWIGLENDPVSSSLVPIVRTWFLQTISSSVLPQKAARASPYLQSTLHWLKFLISNKDWKLEIIRLILPPILELSLMLDEIVGKKSVTDLLQASVCSPDSEQTVVVEQTLNEFIGRNLAFNSNRLFKLIEVISFLNTDLVKRILPKIREQVAITETKRGTGTDSVLRQHLRTLELSLGGSKN